MSPGTGMKQIAPNVNKTGYAKIAELVELPENSDISQAQKMSNDIYFQRR